MSEDRDLNDLLNDGYVIPPRAGVGASDDPPTMALICPGCEAAVLAEPRGHALVHDSKGMPIARYSLLQCPAEHPLVVSQVNLGGGFGDDLPRRLLPPEDRQLSAEIPQGLREAHQEARTCLRAKAFKAAVVMSGRTLEGACEAQGLGKGTLEQRLAQMKDDGLIDGRLYEWATTLRQVRNAAAHFNEETVSRQDAEDCLALAEALLDYLYVLSARFEALKKRRQPGSRS